MDGNLRYVCQILFVLIDKTMFPNDSQMWSRYVERPGNRCLQHPGPCLADIANFTNFIKTCAYDIHLYDS